MYVPVYPVVVKKKKNKKAYDSSVVHSRTWVYNSTCWAERAWRCYVVLQLTLGDLLSVLHPLVGTHLYWYNWCIRSSVPFLPSPDEHRHCSQPRYQGLAPQWDLMSWRRNAELYWEREVGRGDWRSLQASPRHLVQGQSRASPPHSCQSLSIYFHKRTYVTNKM